VPIAAMIECFITSFPFALIRWTKLPLTDTARLDHDNAAQQMRAF
jgi:hypothetical protein